MNFDEYDWEQRMYELWNQVRIERPVHYSLFTFGESDLPYLLVTEPEDSGELVGIREGEIKITRPMIITPDNARPEFENFFEDDDGDRIARYLLQRSAAFSNLRFFNRGGEKRLMSDSTQEVLSRLNRRLDDEEEDRVAILVAPESLAGLALLKYATQRVVESAPDNVQELRERGFLD